MDFFEVDGSAVAEELELFDVEDGRYEKVGRDGDGKMELKGLVRERGGGFNYYENNFMLEKRSYAFSGTVILNDCTPNSAGASDGM